MRDANDLAHAFGLRVKFGMVEQAPHENSGFRLFNIQVDEAVLRMA